jgi:effector-binding domain-containing protein
VTPFELPGGRVVTGIHVGPYESLEVSYRELAGWAATRGHALAGPMWESYLTDPRTDPEPATRQTRITWPPA